MIRSEFGWTDISSLLDLNFTAIVIDGFKVCTNEKQLYNSFQHKIFEVCCVNDVVRFENKRIKCGIQIKWSKTERSLCWHVKYWKEIQKK